MARRGNNASSAGGVILLFFAGVAVLWSKAYEAFGAEGMAASVIVLVGLPIMFARAKRRRRLLYLRARYADEQTVQMIYARKFWTGQTETQLRDSLGAPRDVETKALATRRREIWKYQQDGKNRHRLRITLDNGQITGWEQR